MYIAHICKLNANNTGAGVARVRALEAHCVYSCYESLFRTCINSKIPYKRQATPKKNEKKADFCEADLSKIIDVSVRSLQTKGNMLKIQ